MNKLLWAIPWLAAASGLGCSSKLRIVDFAVVTGTAGDGRIEGNAIWDTQEGELFVSYLGSGQSQPALARTRHAAVVNFVRYVKAKNPDGDRARSPRCEGEAPPALTIAKYAEPREIDLAEVLDEQAVPIEYLIVLTNVGGTPIEQVTIVDTLPKGFHPHEVQAISYARTLGKTILFSLTFWQVYPFFTYFGEDSALTSFDSAAHDVVLQNGLEHLVVKLEMHETPLKCSGNRSYVMLRVSGTMDIPRSLWGQ
jgi:hypothetical protein